MLLFTKMIKEQNKGRNVADDFKCFCSNKLLEFKEVHIKEYCEDLFEYASDTDNPVPDRKLIMSFDLPEKKVSESYLECLEEMLANVFEGAANKITIRTVKETSPQTYERFYPGKNPIIIHVDFVREADRMASEYCSRIKKSEKP